MEKLDFQSRLPEREAIERGGRERQNDGNGDEGSIGRAAAKAPKMPYFDEERDFMDSYLGRFEHFAETQKCKREHWATSMACATGFNRQTVQEFFTNLREVRSRYTYQPQNIYNVDETGVTTVQKPGQVLAAKGDKTSWASNQCRTWRFGHHLLLCQCYWKYYASFFHFSTCSFF